jgi:hypothetical protein
MVWIIPDYPGLTPCIKNRLFSEILKEGSLTKKAEYKKTWRSRYFILFKERGDSYDMTYFNVIRYDQKQRMDYCWDLKRSPILQI